MKLFELLYLLNKHMRTAIAKFISKPNYNPLYIIKAYNNVNKKLVNKYDKKKTITHADIQKVDLTEYMKSKLQFLLLQKIKVVDIKKLKQQQLTDDLIEFTGIGKSKAKSLIDSGLASISDLRKKLYKDQLNDATILLMKYKPNRKIPYNSIKSIEKKLTGFPNTQLVGSFRRKKPTSRDIDVMIVSNKKTVLDEYLVYLTKKFKTIHIYAKGLDKVSLIVLIDEKKTNSPEYYKLDIFRCPIVSQYAMLLYSTGSKDFNIKMRATASRLGYLLNQNGIFLKNTDKILKKESTHMIPVKSEKGFFKLLNMPYVEPHKR
jgi:DNA polymerase/3'-5' exonuclease PolX